MGVLCALYAKQRGRHPISWFFIGVLLGIVGILLLFILPIKKETPQTHAPSQQPPEEDPNKPFAFWYYVDEQECQQGPMSEKAFLEAKEEGKVNPLSLVWNTSMKGWKRLEEI